MTLDAVKPDLSYLGAFKGKKVLLRGNHDYWWHSISALRGILPYNMYAVQNRLSAFRQRTGMRFARLDNAGKRYI